MTPQQQEAYEARVNAAAAHRVDAGIKEVIAHYEARERVINERTAIWVQQEIQRTLLTLIDERRAA